MNDKKSGKPFYKRRPFWFIAIVVAVIAFAGIFGATAFYWLMFIGSIALLVWMFWYDRTHQQRWQTEKKKNGKLKKPYHKRWWTWALVVILFFGGFGNAMGWGDDDDSDNEASKPRTHKVAKKAVKKQKAKPAPAKKKAVKPKAKPKPKPKKVVKKKPTKQKAKPKPKKKPAKKAPKASKKQTRKQNLADLKRLLANMPRKTDHAIIKAYVGEGGLDIRVVLNDNLLDQSDAALRKDCREVWQAATNLAHATGPFPSGDLDYTEPLVYVEDSSGDELAKTNMWGDFKWEGQ